MIITIGVGNVLMILSTTSCNEIGKKSALSGEVASGGTKGRGVAAEDVKHPGTDTDLGRALTALALSAASDTCFVCTPRWSQPQK